MTGRSAGFPPLFGCLTSGTMAGTLWIDEASLQVIRVESYFRDDYNRTVQGSSMRIEFTLVNDEVWLAARRTAG